MKLGYFIALLSLVLCGLFSPFAIAQKSNNLVETISLSGIVRSDVGSSTTTTITLYQNGKKIRSVYPNAQGKYELELNFQSDYEIVFASEGNVPKKMLVNTETEGDDDEYDIPTLNFNIQLPKSTGGPIDEAYQTPVSRLFIDEALGNFNRDTKVEANFKAELKKKTDEHKKWLENQKKDEAEKRRLEEERKREEELARKKALEDARLAEAEKAKLEAAERARLEKEAIEKKRLEEEAKKQAQKDALAAENERLRQEEEQRKLNELERKKAEEEKRLRDAEDAKLKQQQLEAERQAQFQKMRDDQEALAKAQRQAELEKELQRQAELEELNRKRAEAERLKQLEEEEKARLAAQKALENQSALQERDYRIQKNLIDSLNQFHARQQISKEEYLERQRQKIATLKPNKDLENTIKISEEKGVKAHSKILDNQEKAKEDYEKFVEEDTKRQTITARQLKIQSDNATIGNQRTKELDKGKQSRALTEIEERQAKRDAYIQARKQKEEEKERERAQLLKEAMERGNTPVLTPFVNGDGKHVGTVNYNDGRGNIPVTAEEYKQIQDRLRRP